MGSEMCIRDSFLPATRQCTQRFCSETCKRVHHHGEIQVSAATSVENPTTAERESWAVKLLHYHRAAGHPSNRSLARLVETAGRPGWQVEMALDLKCDACAASRPGGMASGQIPPASVAPLPEAWTHVGIDVGEWPVPRHGVKIKFLLMVDLATKLKRLSLIHI